MWTVHCSCLQDHGNNANPDCNYGPSGAAVAGGFGWLAPDTGKCGGTIDIALGEGGSDTGNNAPGHCATELNHWGAEITAGRKITVLLPVFNKVTGTGAGAVYGLVSFAAFEVTGWKFSGGETSGPVNSLPKVPQRKVDGHRRYDSDAMQRQLPRSHRQIHQVCFPRRRLHPRTGRRIRRHRGPPQHLIQRTITHQGVLSEVSPSRRNGCGCPGDCGRAISLSSTRRAPTNARWPPPNRWTS